MTNETRPLSHSVVRWIFKRGQQLLTCRVDRDADGSSYTTSVVPHGNLELTTVETFETGLSALHKHACIAGRLRQLGWTLVGYTDGPETRPVAA
jgi:hypothetical protein